MQNHFGLSEPKHSFKHYSCFADSRFCGYYCAAIIIFQEEKSMKNFVRWTVLWAVLLVLPAQVLAVQFYISTDDILQNAVTGNIIAAGAVTNDKIQVGTITKDRLAFTVDSAKYGNLVIVAKSGGDFTSPIDAINSVTTASAANPFVVKVMPGVYDLGTSSLQMKEYVYLEGSGEDSTVITSTVQVLGDNTCDSGTINMANNSSVKKIQIKNSAQNGTSGYANIGISFANVMAKVEDVKVFAGNAAVTGGVITGICSGGSLGYAILNNVTVEANNGSASAFCSNSGGYMTILNSRGVAVTNGTAIAVDSRGEGPVGTVVVTNSYLEAKGIQGGGSRTIDAGACNINISNSKMFAQDDGSDVSYGMWIGNDSVIKNSEIHVAGSGAGIDGASSTTKVANTLIQNGFSTSSSGYKSFNNYDENFSAIPNQ